VKHIIITLNRNANFCFCLLEVRHWEAVEKYHEKYSIKCN
jgi:hypothetical protein